MKTEDQLLDKEFLCKELRINNTPWRIQDVSFVMWQSIFDDRPPEKQIEVWVECKMGSQWLKDSELLDIEGNEVGVWKHLDTMGHLMNIKAKVPKVRHKDGTIKRVKVPWAAREYQTHQLEQYWARRYRVLGMEPQTWEPSK